MPAMIGSKLHWECFDLGASNEEAGVGGASMGTRILVCTFSSANVVLHIDPFPSLLTKSI